MHIRYVVQYLVIKTLMITDKDTTKGDTAADNLVCNECMTDNHKLLSTSFQLHVPLLNDVKIYTFHLLFSPLEIGFFCKSTHSK